MEITRDEDSNYYIKTRGKKTIIVKAVGQDRVAFSLYYEAFKRDCNEEESRRLPGGFVSFDATVQPRSLDLALPFSTASNEILISDRFVQSF